MMGLSSKSRLTAVLVAAVVATSVLMGCREKTKPPTTKPTTQPAIHWGRAHKGIVCGLGMDRPRYVVGQTVRMSIWVKNTRPQAVTFEVGQIMSSRTLKNGCTQMHLIVDALGGQFTKGKTVKVPGGGVSRILVLEAPTRPSLSLASDWHFVPGKTTVAVLCTPLFDKKVPLTAETLPGATSGQAVVEVVPAIAVLKATRTIVGPKSAFDTPHYYALLAQLRKAVPETWELEVPAERRVQPISWPGGGGVLIRMRPKTSRLFGQRNAFRPQISSLMDPTYLYPSDNQLTAFPPQIARLTELTELNLPPQIGEPTDLTSGDVSRNKLTAPPAQIGNLTNLFLSDKQQYPLGAEVSLWIMDKDYYYRGATYASGMHSPGTEKAEALELTRWHGHRVFFSARAESKEDWRGYLANVKIALINTDETSADSPQAKPGKAGGAAAGVMKAAGPIDSGWSKPVNGLRARVLCEKATFDEGEPIEITLELQCFGEKDYDYPEKPLKRCQLFPHVYVYVAKECKRVRLMAYNRVWILKGKIFRRMLRLSELVAVDRPGKYVVRAGHANYYGTDGGDWTGDAFSPPVTITVVQTDKPRPKDAAAIAQRRMVRQTMFSARVHFSAGRPTFEEVIETISRQTGVRIQPNWVELGKLNLTPKRKLFFQFDLTHTPLSVLGEVLRGQVGFATDRVLYISSKAEINRLAGKVPAGPVATEDIAWGKAADGIRVGLSPKMITLGPGAKTFTVRVWYENVSRKAQVVPVHQSANKNTLSANMYTLMFSGSFGGKPFYSGYPVRRSRTMPPRSRRLKPGEQFSETFQLGLDDGRYEGTRFHMFHLPSLNPGKTLTLRAGWTPFGDAATAAHWNDPRTRTSGAIIVGRKPAKPAKGKSSTRPVATQSADEADAGNKSIPHLMQDLKGGDREAADRAKWEIGRQGKAGIPTRKAVLAKKQKSGYHPLVQVMCDWPAADISDRRHSPFFQALTTLARGQKLNQGDWLPLGFIPSAHGHVTLLRVGRRELLVAVIGNTPRTHPGTSAQQIVLLDKTGKILDSLGCYINSRYGAIRAVVKDKPDPDGARIVITFPPNRWHNWHKIICRRKSYMFREDERNQDPKWDRKGLCRIGIEGHHLAVLFPKLWPRTGGSELEFRLIAHLPGAKHGPVLENPGRYVRELTMRGPAVANMLIGEFQWFEARCELPALSITAEHGGRKYVYLANVGRHMMVPHSSAPRGRAWGLKRVYLVSRPGARAGIGFELDGDGVKALDALARDRISALAVLIDGKVLATRAIQRKRPDLGVIEPSLTDAEVRGLVASLSRGMMNDPEPATQPGAKSTSKPVTTRSAAASSSQAKPGKGKSSTRPVATQPPLKADYKMGRQLAKTIEETCEDRGLWSVWSMLRKEVAAKGKDMLPGLVALVEKGDERVGPTRLHYWVIAAYALGDIGDKRAAPFLAARLKDPATRRPDYYFVNPMGRLGVKALVPRLVRWIQEDDKEDRIWAGFFAAPWGSDANAILEALQAITGKDFGAASKGPVDRNYKNKKQILAAIKKWWAAEGRKTYAPLEPGVKSSSKPATTRSAPSGQAAADSSQAQPALPGPVLRGLGGRLAIRVEANSWEALVKKVAPTFTWGGRDMMWIGKGQKGDPRFTMERAYVYQPAGKAPRWVLLEYKDARFGKWVAQIRGECIRRTAKLYASKPKSDHGSGNYAVAKDVAAKAGTVYEVGWQALMGGGVGHVEAERRLYLWHDADGKWHFVGEGPKESTAKMGYARMRTYRTASRVMWTGSPVMPAVKFTVTCTDHEWRTSDEPDFIPRRDRIQYSQCLLDGPFPATLRRTTRRRYMLPAKGETFDTLVQHLASWTSGPDRDTEKHRADILALWREALTRLNPKLPRGAIPKGTRIYVLTYAELLDAMKSQTRRGGKIRAGSAREQ